MNDKHQTLVAASATSSIAVVKSDTTLITFSALYIGADGNVAIEHHADETPIVYPNLLAGSILPVEGVRVMNTNTTIADGNIVAMTW